MQTPDLKFFGNPYAYLNNDLAVGERRAMVGGAIRWVANRCCAARHAGLSSSKSLYADWSSAESKREKATTTFSPRRTGKRVKVFGLCSEEKVAIAWLPAARRRGERTSS